MPSLCPQKTSSTSRLMTVAVICPSLQRHMHTSAMFPMQKEFPGWRNHPTGCSCFFLQFDQLVSPIDFFFLLEKPLLSSQPFAVQQKTCWTPGDTATPHPWNQLLLPSVTKQTQQCPHCSPILPTLGNKLLQQSVSLR